MRTRADWYLMPYGIQHAARKSRERDFNCIDVYFTFAYNVFLLYLITFLYRLESRISYDAVSSERK